MHIYCCRFKSKNRSVVFEDSNLFASKDDAEYHGNEMQRKYGIPLVEIVERSVIDSGYHEEQILKQTNKERWITMYLNRYFYPMSTVTWYGSKTYETFEEALKGGRESDAYFFREGVDKREEIEKDNLLCFEPVVWKFNY